ncbi:MAG: methyltransferase domain-containing protein [Dokdonella sp.]|uniref:methyltransferase domain-containing protein n=1 Tax=Dokdonella sp. TaxID=2291710 RepID=UPI003F809DDB
MKCRFCAASIDESAPDTLFLDLGTAPPSNAFLAPAQLSAAESYLPLRLHTCPRCLLVQIDEIQPHERLFAPDYVYFSSYSRSWLEHARTFVEQATRELDLGGRNLVVEIASNDGYLLQYVAAKGIPCVGSEPTAGTAEAARAKGVDTIEAFFGERFARGFIAERGRADLVVANNVLAHVPDLNDFVAGIATVLAPGGVASVEFPHLLELVLQRQFDTVYHEHFSYFSLHVARAVFAAHGLCVHDVERLATHGGSLRLWASHADEARAESARLHDVLSMERAAGMLDLAWYGRFQHEAEGVKNDLLRFLLEQRQASRAVAGYGAAAKGNTLLNYAGVRRDLLPFVVDASPHKQGRYLPGSRIPVVAEARLLEARPDVVLILPWNLRAEIVEQLAYIRDWGGRFAVAVPRLDVF